MLSVPVTYTSQTLSFFPRELITATSFYGDTANSFPAALDSCYEAAIAPFPGH